MHVVAFPATIPGQSQQRLREWLLAEDWELTTSPVVADGVAAAGGEWRARQRHNGAELTVRWVQGCHNALLRALPARSAALVVFNLGYLPGGDKAFTRAFTTTVATTIPALEAAERVVAIGGCVSATIYPGHPEGLDEEVAVLEHAANLTQGEWCAPPHPAQPCGHATRGVGTGGSARPVRAAHLVAGRTVGGVSHRVRVLCRAGQCTTRSGSTSATSATSAERRASCCCNCCMSN